jgi:tetratricopeptide (TPR) repeat protein
MRSALIIAVVALAISLMLFLPRASVAAGSDAPSGSCNVTGGGIGSGGNTVTCNFGMPPEQLKATIEAAVDGRLIDRIVDISKTLGVTEDAAKSLLKIIGEDSDIPDDQLGEALAKAGKDFQRLRLQLQIAEATPDNPTARSLVGRAKEEVEAAHFERAEELLRQATKVQIAAAQEANQLMELAEAAVDAQMLGAASSTAAEGDVAMTERRYQEAAELFAQAAGYVPSRHASEHGGYLLREADALYQQGDERGDNDALRSSIDVYGRALADYPRPQAPLDWAKAQTGLGKALAALGEREIGKVRLEDAVQAYRAALEELTRQRAPLDWAATQTNLGKALTGSASGKAARRGWRKRWRPIAKLCRSGRPIGLRSTGR